ncbi:MAG: hypothetical protein KC441_10950 [Anaerolineales bacterium]|nr:hypothetical protein [Anaerolineales bacterium]
MAHQRISPKVFGLLLALVLSSPLLNLAGGRGLFVTGPAPVSHAAEAERGETVDTAVSLDVLAADSQFYLQTEFCQDSLCPSGGWQQWVIVDAESAWTATELATLHQALVDTFAALADVGINGRHLLAGYRFRYQPGERLNGRQESIALARHELGEIILTDGAFDLQNGFSIYHELGHAVDNRLQRQLTNGFIEVIGGGEDYRRENGYLIPDGYWVRTQTRLSPYEATADAFAVWVTTGYLQSDEPIFNSTPPDVSYRGIDLAVRASLLLAVAKQETEPIVGGK